MCYSNCPYEKFGNPETAGDCAKPKMQGTSMAHCFEPAETNEEEDNVGTEYEDWYEQQSTSRLISPIEAFEGGLAVGRTEGRSQGIKWAEAEAARLILEGSTELRFEKYWQEEEHPFLPLPFPSDHQELKEWCRQAFIAGTVADYGALAKEAMRYKDTLDRISSMCKVGCAGCEAIYTESEAALDDFLEGEI